MQVTIHRGSHEIGGSCVEIDSQGSRIVLDIGMPLVDADGGRFDFNKYKDLSGVELVGKGILPDISGFYEWDTESRKIDGLLISHAHLDHYGFLNYIRNDICCYLGEGAKRIVDFSSSFFGYKYGIDRFAYLTSGEPVSIASFKITPFLMDHSAFDSYAFFIETPEKRILYSGDFREHGRKAKSFYWFMNKIPQGIDAVLLEGSLFGRTSAPQKTEYAIEEDIKSIIEETAGIVFCIVSGQNIDRLVSFFKAARRTKRLFVVDVYTANVLDSIKDLATIPYPSKKFGNVRVFYPKWQCDKLRREGKQALMTRFRDFAITKKEISEDPGKIVMLARQSMTFDLSRINGIDGASVIYSMWEGYLKDKSMKKFMDFLSEKRMKIHRVHTSGHASLDTLKKVVDKIRPKAIIPIHTFYPEQYKDVFPNVLETLDGVGITI